MPVSNQTRYSPATAVLIVSAVLAAAGVVAGLLSMLWHPLGPLVIAGAFIGCGLTRHRRQRATSLPRPAAAPLPSREPARLAA